MKKAKEFLMNVMIVQECKGKIAAIMQKYPKGASDEDLQRPDLEELITNLKTIIQANEKNKTPVPEDIACLKTLEELLKQKTT